MWWLQLRCWRIYSYILKYFLRECLLTFNKFRGPCLSFSQSLYFTACSGAQFFFGDHEYSTLAHETMIYHFIFLSCLDISDVDIKCHTLFILHTRAISLILHINPSNHTTWIRRDFLSNLRGECLGILALYLYGSHDHSTRHLHTNNRQLRHGFYTAKIPKNHCTIQWRILLLPKHSGR